MCGIVMYKDFRGNDVVPLVKRRFKAQRSRGTQGFGYYIPETNRLTHNTRESRILRNMSRQTASEVLFHHRFPTSTENVQNACHPFSTRWDKFKHNYVMVHNGYLSNEFTLQADHEDLGINYVSMQDDKRFNDSEALAYDLALYLEGHQPKLNAKGAIAFIMIERDETGKAIKMHFGRNSSSPLKMTYKPGKYLSLASEGKGEDVIINRHYTLDYATGEITWVELDIPGYTYHVSPSTSKGWASDYFTKNYSADNYDKYGDYQPYGSEIRGSSQARDAKLLEDYYGVDSKSGLYLPSNITSNTNVSGDGLSDETKQEAYAYLQGVLFLAGDDANVALEQVELDLTQVSNKLHAKKERSDALHNGQDEKSVNEYLDLLYEIDGLKIELAMHQYALSELEVIIDTVDAYDAGEIEMEADNKVVDGVAQS